MRAEIAKEARMQKARDAEKRKESRELKRAGVGKDGAANVGGKERRELCERGKA